MGFCVNSPGLANIDNINTVRSSLPQIWLHMDLEVLATKVTLCSQKIFDVLRCWIEYGWKITRSHRCNGFSAGRKCLQNSSLCLPSFYWNGNKLVSGHLIVVFDAEDADIFGFVRSWAVESWHCG